IPREDWLTGAETIVERDGVRIGIYRDPRHRHRTSAINFHGVTTSCCLPMIIERDRQWSAKVDIVDAPQIHLVFPARKAELGRATVRTPVTHTPLVARPLL